MIGTILNFAAILLGGLIGLLAGSRIPLKVRQTLTAGLGLFTLAYGVHLFTQTQNMLVPLSSIVLGTISGEALKIEELLNSLGERIQHRSNAARRLNRRMPNVLSTDCDRVSAFLHRSDGNSGFHPGRTGWGFSDAGNQIAAGRHHRDGFASTLERGCCSQR